MKMNKKKVFVTALVVCLVAILSAGSLAWFSASDSVTNSFYIADSNGDGYPDFSVEVLETDPTTEDPTSDGITYIQIAPGDKLSKDPTVKNTGDYDEWIRVYITFSSWSELSAACAKAGVSADLTTWLNIDTNKWIYNTSSATTNSITYVYYYNAKLAAGSEVKLFDTVTIPYQFDQDDMHFTNGSFTITVKAEALQADNTGNNAVEAFSKYWPLNGEVKNNVEPTY